MTAVAELRGAADEKRRISEFMQGFTIETTPGSAAKTPDYRVMLRPGTLVAVTFLPGSDFADTIAVSKRLKAEGFRPAPHFAARSVPSKAAFEDYLVRLQGEVGVEDVVALAGAVPSPLGPFESSMDLLKTGLFEKHGIKTIGVAGHPEGSPDISDALILEALKWKNDYARSSEAKFYIATQFCFEAEPIIAWDKAMQAEGNTLPIHIGIPGLATLKTLLGHAKACGIGNSMRLLTKQALNVAKLLVVSTPDELVRDLANYKATDPKCGIAKVHMYPLGGMKKSAAWSYAVAEGAFELKRKGFEVTRPIE